MEEDVNRSRNEIETSKLEERLREHSSHFTSMVRLIPTHFYVTRDETDAERDSKYWVNKVKSKAPKLSVKKATRKAKKLKLDLDGRKAVADLPEGGESQETGVVEKEEQSTYLATLPTGSIINGFSVERVQSTSLSDLQERLKTKLEALRGQRKAAATTGSDEIAEEERTCLKREKRMEKRKWKKELRKKKLIGKKSSNGQRVPQGLQKISKEPTRPSIKDENGRIVFSKFDFSTSAQAEVRGASNGPKKRDYKKLLARAEAAQKKLEELKKKDVKRGEELEKKLQWEKALDMARGMKIKDDPKLLRKTAKNLEKKKHKSSKEWEKRAEIERQAKEKQQEKRKKNIRERVEQIKTKKMKKRSKRGSGTRKPGF